MLSWTTFIIILLYRSRTAAFHVTYIIRRNIKIVIIISYVKIITVVHWSLIACKRRVQSNYNKTSFNRCNTIIAAIKGIILVFSKSHKCNGIYCIHNFALYVPKWRRSLERFLHINAPDSLKVECVCPRGFVRRSLDLFTISKRL